MNWGKNARSENRSSGPSPNPAWDKLMMGHGFTREHNLPRSHAYMLLDQYVVDRAFGGRFVPKDGWRYLARNAGAFNVNEMVTDLYPGNSDHKPFRPGTAAAVNPVCLNCKTQDHILDWAYMGDPAPTAKWSRSSKVVEMAREMKNAANCHFCHDPHAARPRIVRDGLIQALTRPEKDTLWHKDERGAKIEVKDMGVRGHTRKIALLDRYDTKLQCGQCHVEYNCNPGSDPTTGQPIGMRSAHNHSVQGREPDRQTLHGSQIPRLQARNHRRAAVERPASGCRELLQLQAPESRHRMPPVPYAEDEGRENRQDLYLPLADQPAQLHQANLSEMPRELEREAGAVRDGFAQRTRAGQAAQGRVLAHAHGASSRKQSGCGGFGSIQCATGTMGPHSLGM